MSISDNELAEVTGQVGISICMHNFNMDMSIANFTYGDTDIGTITVSNHNIGYGAGYINIGPIELKNVYVSAAGNPVWAYGTTVTSAHLQAASTYSDAQLATLGMAYVGRGANCLRIDVMTADASTANPYYSIRGKTGVLIRIPDMFVSLDGINLDGIYFDSINGKDYVAGQFNPYTEKWIYGSTYAKDPTKSVGSFHINGITIETFSSVAGVFKDGAFEYRSTYKLTEDAFGNPERYYPNNEAYLLITPH